MAINKESNSYKIGENNIQDLISMDISHFYFWVKSVNQVLNQKQKK